MILPVVLAVVAGLLVTQLAMFATSVYLHRGVTHQALIAHPALAFACRCLLVVSTGMRPREWAAVHRRHHAATDTPEDPHRPVQVGFWRVQLTNAAMYRRAARDGVTPPKYARDLPSDRFDRVLFDHAGLGLGVGITLLCLLFMVPFGPWGIALGFLAAAVHMASYLGLSGAVNAVGHTYGRRPHPNSATNGWLHWLDTRLVATLRDEPLTKSGLRDRAREGVGIMCELTRRGVGFTWSRRIDPVTLSIIERSAP